jgi:uncharacterized protein
MSRLVLDTNVVVSAFLVPHGNEGKVLRLALTAKHQLCASEEILEEYRRILCKPKFKLRSSDVNDFITTAQTRAVFVYPAHRLNISQDEADNRFLECAEAASANFLVTGNKKHFPPRWKSTYILNSREWLEATLSF